MAIFGLGQKKDDRPVDVGLASLLGKSEGEATEWWKQRLVLIAAIPSEVARIGALTPQLRELARIEDEGERKRLTRARLVAYAALPQDVQRTLAEARQKAWDVDRGVLEADQKLVDELVPTLDEKVRAAYPQRKA